MIDKKHGIHEDCTCGMSRLFGVAFGAAAAGLRDTPSLIAILRQLRCHDAQQDLWLIRGREITEREKL